MPKKISEKLWIKYFSNGIFTERFISNISVTELNMIEAFCHLRNEERTFCMWKIIELRDSSDAIIENIFDYFVPERKISEFEQCYGHLMPSLRCLKYYAARTRGVREREILKMKKFVDRNTIKHIEELDIAKLIKNLTYGDDVSCYFDLQTIPEEILQECHLTAMEIAKGSGRKPPPPNYLSAIEAMFANRKRVAFSPRSGDYEETVEQIVMVLEAEEENPIDPYSPLYKR